MEQESNQKVPKRKKKVKRRGPNRVTLDRIAKEKKEKEYSHRMVIFGDAPDELV